MIRIAAAAVLAAAALPSPAGLPQRWSESASRDFYDAALQLKWRHLGGDWRDAAGEAQGGKGFASVDIAPGAKTVTMDVTRFVARFGGELMLIRSGEPVEIVSREGGAGPTLAVTLRGETRTLAAAADTTLDPSTYKSLGRAPTIRTLGPVLIRFAQPPHPSVSRAVLTLTLSAPASGAATLKLVAPDAGGDVALPRGRTASAADTVARFTGRDLLRHRDWPANARHARVDGDIVTAWIPPDDLTALAMIMPISGGDEAFATVVMRFAADWEPAVGGKLPGLANTGQGKPAVGGQGAAGWGGRGANGVRWSARTGYGPFDPLSAEAKRWTPLSTYFYAARPNSVWGIGEPWSRPAPKGRWFAYTEHVKLNAPGSADGRLDYWLDGSAVYAKDGIVWRDRGGPATQINEFWFDVYCGGMSCGPATRHAHRLQIASVTIARAAPDFAAVQREVDRLNARR